MSFSAALTLGLLLGEANFQALAQTAPKSPKLDLEAIKQRDQELDALRAEQKKSAETTRKLEDQIDVLGEGRRKLNQSLIDTAADIRNVEEQIAATETRLQPLADKERDLRTALEGRKAAIADILAVLQRMGRRPPPAMLVRPEDALESVRSAMALGAVLPDMRREAGSLANDLAALVGVRAEIAKEREKLTSDLARLSDQRQRMTALIDERQTRQAEVEKSLDQERQRAAALARQADNLKDLIAKLEQGLDPATRAARVAARSSEDGKLNLATLKDPGRLSPGIPFGSAKGIIRLPVNGVKTRDFGAPDGLGGAEKGISIATRAGAQVTAPCDGWVVYSAPYRSYGQLLILNAGDGYHVLLAGMERISVDVGQFVLTGEPVAVMGSGPQVASAVVTGSGQPVLYIEFRKDGTPVDPTPWWVTTDSEKVRG
jgi:septal ring factor EnvC (AmiA/AmiB activator)